MVHSIIVISRCKTCKRIYQKRRKKWMYIKKIEEPIFHWLITKKRLFFYNQICPDCKNDIH
ncbi:MAG: hypothetical protein ABIK21_00630 [bacterium]